MKETIKQFSKKDTMVDILKKTTMENKITGIEIDNILYDIVTAPISDYPCPHCSLYDLCEEANVNDICAKILSENEVFITR